MEILNWWLDQHYIISTLATPLMSLAWSLDHGLVARGIVSVLLCMGVSFYAK